MGILIFITITYITIIYMDTFLHDAITIIIRFIACRSFLDIDTKHLQI